MTTKASIVPMTVIGVEGGTKNHIIMQHPADKEKAILVATCFLHDPHIAPEAVEANALLLSQAPAMAFFIHGLVSLKDYLSPELQASAVELLRRVGIEPDFVNNSKGRFVRGANGAITYEET